MLWEQSDREASNTMFANLGKSNAAFERSMCSPDRRVSPSSILTLLRLILRSSA